MDGNGDKLEPAWTNFVASQAACDTFENTNPEGREFRNSFTTLDPKKLVKPASKGDSKGEVANSGFCHCSYTGSEPFGFDDGLPFETVALLDDDELFLGSKSRRGRRERGRRLEKNQQTRRAQRFARGGGEN